jgi:hypothetical protein
LLEGQYTVNYQIATVGESTVLVGSYTFLLDLPDPILNLETPGNGAGVPEGPVRLVMQSQFIDFSLYDRRIRVYVDGSQIAEIKSFRHVINDLEPGIHEIRTVLTQFEDEELQNTSTTIYIAVAPQDPGQIEPSLIVDSPLDLSALQWAGLALGMMISGWDASRSMPRKSLIQCEVLLSEQPVPQVKLDNILPGGPPTLCIKPIVGCTFLAL